MKQVTINLYELNELPTEARSKAIAEHREFLINVFNPSHYDECDTMTLSKYKKTLTQADVIEAIAINEYLYYLNGEMASVTNYVGKHPKSGTLELKLEGQTYNI